MVMKMNKIDYECLCQEIETYKFKKNVLEQELKFYKSDYNVAELIGLQSMINVFTKNITKLEAIKEKPND